MIEVRKLRSTGRFLLSSNFLSILALALIPGIPFPLRAENKLLVPQSLQTIPVTTNPLSLPSNTQYQTLARHFSSARGVAISDVQGWTSGRCYFKDSPSVAVPGLLISDAVPHAKTDGPVFNVSDFRHITPVVNVEAKADKFDELDAREIASINLALKTTRTANSYPVNSNDELVVAGHRTTDLESRSYRIRKHRKYLMLKLECAEHNYCTNINSWSNNRFLAYEGEAVAYCYYFKPVSPVPRQKSQPGQLSSKSK